MAHRYWTRFHNEQNLVQYSLLAFHWTEYLHRYEDACDALICDADTMDGIDHLLLVLRSLLVYLTVLLRLAPVLICGFHH